MKPLDPNLCLRFAAIAVLGGAVSAALSGCANATKLQTPIGVSLSTSPPPHPAGDRETALRQQHRPEARAGRVANAAYCDAIEALGYQERHASHQLYCQPAPAAAPDCECPAKGGPALPGRPAAGSGLPPAVRTAEGLHDPPSPGAVTGDVHAGHGVNLTAAVRRLERELWAEASAWARWTDDEACRRALAEVHYALGAPAVQGFDRMRGEIASGDWKEAAYELRQSRWARQVGDRAERIAATLETECGA